MWHNLASPPQNYRYYQFTQMPNDPQQLNLDDNKRNLFKNHNDHLSQVPEESFLKVKEQTTQNTTINRPISSLKSTSKAKKGSKALQHNSYDLSNRGKHINHQTQSKSLLQNTTKQKSSLLISNKPSPSIKEKINKNIHKNQYAKNKNSQNKSAKIIKRQQISASSYVQQRQSINNEQDNLSQIFFNQMNKTEEQIRKHIYPKDKDKGIILLETLNQIKEIQKQQLLQQRKFNKLAQQKAQISFLYDRDQKSDIKMSKHKKQKENRKSFKRNSQKSTIKKLGKSTAIEQRLSKIEQKNKLLQKRIDQYQLFNKGLNSNRLKKKSMSNLR